MRENLKEIFTSFFDQTKTDHLASSHFPSHYEGVKLKVGFGVGNVARIPWIAFLAKDQKVTNGIFPVYYYFKEQDKLILAYGISETEIPKKSWFTDARKKTVAQYFHQFRIEPYKYGLSYVYEVYDTTKPFDWKKMEDDLHNLIHVYKKTLLG
jgi:5-methylcytosine-specific restriction protein B